MDIRDKSGKPVDKKALQSHFEALTGTNVALARSPQGRDEAGATYASVLFAIGHCEICAKITIAFCAIMASLIPAKPWYVGRDSDGKLKVFRDDYGRKAGVE